jgi:hypothetical protein
VLKLAARLLTDILKVDGKTLSFSVVSKKKKAFQLLKNEQESLSSLLKTMMQLNVESNLRQGLEEV